MNQQYLNLVGKRYQAAVDELEHLLGIEGISNVIAREVIANSLKDIPELVTEVERLNEASREALQKELAERPWERGSVQLVIPGITLYDSLGNAIAKPEPPSDPSGGARCAECGKPFTAEEWGDRHTDLHTGGDVHARCCSSCNLKRRRHVAEAT